MAAAEEPSETARKLFVGGVPFAATEDDLRGYFAAFGEVRSVVVMRDRETGHGRGFGFVEFADEEAAARVLGEGDNPPLTHSIRGRQVDVKRARTRPPRRQDNQVPPGGYESKKVFVGGLRDNVNEQDFRAYFETFGSVADAAVIYDSVTNRSRGFGFVTFDSEESVNRVMSQSFHNLNGTRVEVKIAVPKDEHGEGGRGGGRRAGMRGHMNYQTPAFYGNGYMPHPGYVPAFCPAPYFPVPGYPYANGYINNQGAMMPRRFAPVYGAYGPYPQPYPGVNVGPVDTQDVGNTARITAKLEDLKLDSQ